MVKTSIQSLLLSEKLLSMSEAARYTPYSAEYLSLRARTGHLEAIKIARNWVTTKRAILRYMKMQQAKHWRLNGSEKELV